MSSADALEKWKRKLELLESAEAEVSGAAAKFEVQEQIAEAKQRISQIEAELTTVDSSPDGSVPRTSIKHNLPRLQPFFGREEELEKIAAALDPEDRTWGALIDGPGGMGKTSLAVRAAHAVSPEQFRRIAFVSLKTRELDEDGIRDLSGYLVSGLFELFSELARELERPEIPKAIEQDRPRLLLEALRDTQTLLILDNLESLTQAERGQIFNFVKRLPQGCKAILTARGRIGSGAEELILQRLSQEAALATLAELATHNPELAKTSEAERIALFTQTAGNPLLLRWTAGQLGRGHCRTFTDAIAFLHSCPPGNDPLEFVFGDLVEGFSEAETRVLCALTFFTLPAKVEHIRTLTEPDRLSEGQRKRSEAEVVIALKLLSNRSLVVPSEELQTFALVPMVAAFLRKHRPAVVDESGDRLEKRAYALIVEYGGNQHDLFPVLDAAWPTIAAALPRIIAGSNDTLQAVCDGLVSFLDFTGRWEERLALCRDAERRSVECGDFYNAGWRTRDVAWVHILRNEPAEVLSHVDRTETYWRQTNVSEREFALLLRDRGLGLRLAKDFPASIAALRECVERLRAIGRERADVATALNSLAGTEHASGDHAAAERDYREALRIALAVGDHQGVAIYTSNLAELALDRHDWTGGEALAREALPLAENVGRLELIAEVCRNLANALFRQGEKDKALPFARRSVEIYSRLSSPDIAGARQILANCEA